MMRGLLTEFIKNEKLILTINLLNVHYKWSVGTMTSNCCIQISSYISKNYQISF